MYFIIYGTRTWNLAIVLHLERCACSLDMFENGRLYFWGPNNVMRSRLYWSLIVRWSVGHLCWCFCAPTCPCHVWLDIFFNALFGWIAKHYSSAISADSWLEGLASRLSGVHPKCWQVSILAMATDFPTKHNRMKVQQQILKWPSQTLSSCPWDISGYSLHRGTHWV